MTTLVQSKTRSHVKYVGTRPKNDHEHYLREKLCHLVKDVGCFYEICAEKLYLVYLAKDEDADKFCEHENDPNCPFILFNFRRSPNLNYEAFNMDFGPFNLAVTHLFCSRVKVCLDTQMYRHPDKYLVVVLDDSDTGRKLNATLLVAIAAMVLLNMTDSEVWQRLNFSMMCKEEPGEPSKQLVFREKKSFTDVSGNRTLMMSVTILDCIKAFYAALQMRWYDYFEFDHAEYLFYETVMSGDLNWIVPGKILAFAGPSDTAKANRVYNRHPPSFYYHYFKDHNVTTIIRLNAPEYDSSSFNQLGFDHHDLIFPDGYPPTTSIAAKFIRIVDQAKGAVAVHCYAGIGRTGTLIAAYLMARYDMTPQMAVAWTRICRPGSVIGEQQDWLLTKFDDCSVKKSACISPKAVKQRRIKSPSSPQTEPQTPIKLPGQPVPKTTYAVAARTYGQARALLLTKTHKQREQAAERPCTRSNLIARNSLDSLAQKPVALSKRLDVVLDLGKTVPLMLCLGDLIRLKGEKNPPFYRLKESRYEWKVKFPKAGYVELRHDYPRDASTIMELNLEPDTVIRVPVLDFRYENEDGTTFSAVSSPALSSDEQKVLESPQRLKPVVYYLLFWTMDLL